MPSKTPVPRLPPEAVARIRSKAKEIFAARYENRIKPSRLMNPDPLVKALFDLGFTVGHSIVVCPFIIIECGAGPKLINRSRAG